jgi:hypothetical protein
MYQLAVITPAWYALSRNSSKAALGELALRRSSYRKIAVPPSGAQNAPSGVSCYSMRPSGSGTV